MGCPLAVAPGGVLYSDSPLFVVDQAAMQDNLAGGNGGAITLQPASPSCAASVLPTAISAAAMPLLNLTGSNVSGCTAGGSGGGLHMLCNTALSIMGSRFTGNRAQGSGGGFYLSSAVTAALSGVTFHDNTAALSGTGSGGAAAITGAALAATGCSFSANTAAGDGGALSLTATPQASIVGCSFSGNAAVTRSGRGGAIAAVNVAALIIGSSFLVRAPAGSRVLRRWLRQAQT